MMQGEALLESGSFPADSKELDPRAVKLRQMLVKERDHSVADLEQYLASFHREEVAAIINSANRNGKTPFHHACQFRSTCEAVDLLIRNDADVNKTTRRGHTALVCCMLSKFVCVAYMLASPVTNLSHE